MVTNAVEAMGHSRSYEIVLCNLAISCNEFVIM